MRMNQENKGTYQSIFNRQTRRLRPQYLACFFICVFSCHFLPPFPTKLCFVFSRLCPSPSPPSFPPFPPPAFRLRFKESKHKAQCPASKHLPSFYYPSPLPCLPASLPSPPSALKESYHKAPYPDNNGQTPSQSLPSPYPYNFH